MLAGKHALGNPRAECLVSPAPQLRPSIFLELTRPALWAWSDRQLTHSENVA